MKKQACSPFASGGGGHSFEIRVQSAFAVLMLAEGRVLGLPPLPIQKILPQARAAGFSIDDLVVFLGKNEVVCEAKLLIQVKHRISITKKDPIFSDVIKEAWDDFRNPEVFSCDRDYIALLTGPLAAIDIDHTRVLLEWARDIDSPDEFEMKVTSKASSKEKREKLEVFKTLLKAANNDIPLEPMELLSFLKRFYLVSMDLDVKASMMKSMLHTIISDTETLESESVWTKIKDEIEYRNSNGTPITRASFSKDIRNHFRRNRSEKTIPADLVQIPALHSVPLGDDLETIACALIGSWDLNSQADIERLSDLLQHDISKWSKLFPDFFLNEQGPVRCRAGKCEVSDRLGFLNAVGSRISNKNLDLFKETALFVLSERDPKLDLAPKMRLAGVLFKKEFKHSHAIRQGVADTLALFGSRPECFKQCTKGKAEGIADEVVSSLLYNATWETWASLSTLLPILAEASPSQFLRSFEKLIEQSSSHINVLYSESSEEIIGENYTNGILWGLETVAWDGNYFINAVASIAALGDLWQGKLIGNQPINSLTEIFLPWLPHATVSVEKRAVALKILKKEYQEFTWQLLLELLHNKQFTSVGTRKPLWRQSIPPDWKEEVSQEVYMQSVLSIGSLAIEMAKESLSRLAQLCDHITELPKQTLIEMIPLLESQELLEMPEVERLPVWNSLMALVARHRRFSTADWALDLEHLDILTKIAIQMQPSAPSLFYKDMFGAERFLLIEGSLVLECPYEDQEIYRIKAIHEIIRKEGLPSLINFAENVGNPLHFGMALGNVPDPIEASIILPVLLESHNRHLFLMAKGFVRGSFARLGWEWVDALPYAEWSLDQKGLFFSALPFAEPTWERVVKSLGEEDGNYWKRAELKLAKGVVLDFAIDRLIECGRIDNAVECLSFLVDTRQPLNIPLAIRALSSLPASNSRITDSEISDALKVIKALQNDHNISNADLIDIEWSFLPVRQNYPDFRPARIEQVLAEDPCYFCKVLRLTYRGEAQGNAKEQSSEKEKNIASLTWNLLKDWSILPGMANEGFSKEKFQIWLKEVRTECLRTGHLKTAMNCIGRVFAKTLSGEADFTGKPDVLEILNDKDSEEMRIGYQSGMLERTNGIADLAGEVDKERSQKHRQDASRLEDEGYYRIATSIRAIADYFEKRAGWAIESFGVN